MSNILLLSQGKRRRAEAKSRYHSSPASDISFIWYFLHSQDICDIFAKSDLAKDLAAPLDASEKTTTDSATLFLSNASLPSMSYKRDQWVQFYHLTHRALVSSIREPLITWVRIVQTIVSKAFYLHSMSTFLIVRESFNRDSKTLRLIYMIMIKTFFSLSQWSSEAFTGDKNLIKKESWISMGSSSFSWEISLFLMSLLLSM